jgi:hypothetical protein
MSWRQWAQAIGFLSLLNAIADPQAYRLAAREADLWSGIAIAEITPTVELVLSGRPRQVVKRPTIFPLHCCSHPSGKIMALSHTVTVQFSTGRRREIDHIDCNLFECIEPLTDIHFPSAETTKFT